MTPNGTTQEPAPEFNLFTGGYVFSRLPADSPQFQEGLAWQWRTLDHCIEEGKKRACWNSWIAPHNLEGFFLNMGDMLVKSGDWQMAQKIYANARLSVRRGAQPRSSASSVMSAFKSLDTGQFCLATFASRSKVARSAPGTLAFSER